VSLGQSGIAFTPQCDVNAVLLLLDEIASRFADETSASLILFKEFEVHAAEKMNLLETRGYRRLETPAMNVFDPGFETFEAYSGALKSSYRIEVRHSLRKLARAGAQVRVIVKPSEILATYTPKLHRLYLDVVAKSPIKLEVLSIDFFLELVRQFPEDVELIVIEEGRRTIGTAWTLHIGRVYYCLYLGQDYSFDRKLDIYFNIIYATLGAGLKRRPDRIEFGQTADTFKARLGCRREKRFVFVRGTRWFTRILCSFGDRLIVQSPPPRQFDIYRTGGDAQTPEQDQECTTSS
jgi:predicted N-acyltransferase